MKILFLADINAIHLKRWATFFSNKDHEIHVASFNKCDDDVFSQQITNHKLNRFENNKNLLSKLMKRLSLGSISFNPIYALYQLKNIINKIQPDIVHGHSIIHHTILGAFTDFHPFIVTIWGSDIFIYPKKSYIVNKFVKLTLNVADIITCDGNNVIEEINQMGINKNKICLIYHGTDVIKFSPKTNNSMDVSDLDIRMKYNLKDIPTIISTRSLNLIYDVETLIRTIPLIKNEISEFQVVIIGDGEQMKYLIDLSKELKVMGFVRFIGFIPNILITTFLNASDVYVSTSLSDGGLAASTAEALSCSLPVIVTDFGDNRDWIESSCSGYIFPAKDYEKLSELIIKLIKNPSLRCEMGKNGRNKIMEDLNYYKEMDKMEKLYQKVLNKYIVSNKFMYARGVQ